MKDVFKIFHCVAQIPKHANAQQILIFQAFKMFSEEHNVNGDENNVDIRVYLEVVANDEGDEDLEFVEVNEMVDEDQDGVLAVTLPNNHHRLA